MLAASLPEYLLLYVIPHSAAPEFSEPRSFDYIFTWLEYTLLSFICCFCPFVCDEETLLLNIKSLCYIQYSGYDRDSHKPGRQGQFVRFVCWKDRNITSTLRPHVTPLCTLKPCKLNVSLMFMKIICWAYATWPNLDKTHLNLIKLKDLKLASVLFIITLPLGSRVG